MTTSPPPPGTFPIGLNRALAVAFIVLGVINLLLYAIDSSHPVINLLLGLVLVAVALFLQRGLWGLVVRLHDAVFRRDRHRAPATPAEEH
ncbi:MAG TPA: hypothetical protein PLL33_12585 [Paracoccus sp. (in: a-proteobacteria)]|nr:hypothetical protein [Paracoccus sp. (in: a-proteobacteria)]